mmetsp:Transcript_15476/g.35430  ORF Transcript_15476/g.35430 Transcript_15476/m.35430 type:complete len:199 (-) Transcript_15476:175-771(-)
MNQNTTDRFVPSKAGFHGYCVWVRPEEGTECQAHCQAVMKQFSTRFPPLLMPTWQPHICLAAGITDESAALRVAEQVAAESSQFQVKLSGAEVDGELDQDRATIYFSWQRLRAAWIGASAGAVVNDQGEDALGALCRKARDRLGQDTQTVKFRPHLSLVYFDEDELNNDQRQTIKKRAWGGFSTRNFLLRGSDTCRSN